MTTPVPNLADAAYDTQARPNAVDLTILSEGIARRGVLFGCEVTAQGSPDMSVNVDDGRVHFYPDSADVSAADVSITAAHATLYRRDLIVLDDTGTPSVVLGSPGHADPALGPLAVLPDLPADTVGVASVDVPPAVTAITSAMILDKRSTFPPPPAGSTSFTVVSKTVDETRSNTATLADDDELIVPMAANTIYTVRCEAYFSAKAASDFKWDIAGPASPTDVFLSIQPARINPSGTAIITSEVLWKPTVPAYPTGNLSYLVFTTDSTDMEHILRFSGRIHNGSNAGDLRLRWAQRAAVVENTVGRAGSFIEYIVN